MSAVFKHGFEISALVAAGFLLTGCLVGPDFVRPEAPYLDSWGQGASLEIDRRTGLTTRSEAVADWWILFKDPQLTAFIDEAYQQNLVLEAAGARVYQARAQLGIARGELFPQQQQINGGYEKISISKNDPLVDKVKAIDPSFDPSFQRYKAGFDAGWEIDVCGKIRRDVQSAQSNLVAKIASYDDALVTLTGDIAATYVTIRELQALIAVTRENAGLQKKGLDLANL